MILPIANCQLQLCMAQTWDVPKHVYHQGMVGRHSYPYMKPLGCAILQVQLPVAGPMNPNLLSWTSWTCCKVKHAPRLWENVCLTCARQRLRYKRSAIVLHQSGCLLSSQTNQAACGLMSSGQGEIHNENKVPSSKPYWLAACEQACTESHSYYWGIKLATT